jgi:hypothetical protein
MAKHTFVITDESVNSYGFRLLSSGGNFDNFNKNPVMLYDHIQGYERNSGDPLLPIGRWVNLRQNGPQWLADSEFDEEDTFALKVSKKVDKGFLNACSISVDPIEWSEDPALMLPGQMLPTLTKWSVREISIADIPSNKNCVRLNYQGKTLMLNGDHHNTEELKQLFSTNKPVIENSMKSVIALLNTMITGLSMSDDAKETDVLAAIQKLGNKHREDLSAKDTVITQLTTDRDALKLAKEQAELTAKKERAVLLVDNAIGTKKILAGAKEHFVKLAEDNYESAKAVLDGMVGQESIGLKLQGDGGDEMSLTDKVKKWDELDKANQLVALKTSNWDAYSDLYKAKYGKEPKK